MVLDDVIKRFIRMIIFLVLPVIIIEIIFSRDLTDSILVIYIPIYLIYEIYKHFNNN